MAMRDFEVQLFFGAPKGTDIHLASSAIEDAARALNLVGTDVCVSPYANSIILTFYVRAEKFHEEDADRIAKELLALSGYSFSLDAAEGRRLRDNGVGLVYA